MIVEVDPRLVERAASGDAQALDDLCREIRPRVYGYALWKYRGRPERDELADDAAQETCLAVVTGLPAYQEQGTPFMPWVFSIAARKIADTHRIRGRRPELITDTLPDAADRQVGPEEQAMWTLRLTAVMDRLATLPDRDREVLLLRGLGLSGVEIGERLGMTGNAVRVAQHRALTRLRQTR